MNMQDDETLRMYVEESREHLSDIENDLLTIEEAGADIDEELVNKVFRAAHSIKGGAGFLGLNTIKDLSHKIESVLDMIRSREIVPDPEIINILLIAFDKLRELINNIDESEGIDISEHTVALAGLTTAFLPGERKKTVSNMMEICLPDGRPVFSVSEFDLAQAVKSGKFIFLVEYDLIRDVQKEGKTPLDILNAMQESGIILDCKVDVGAAGTLDDDPFAFRLPFFVLFATIIEPDIVGTLLELEDSYVHQIGYGPSGEEAHVPSSKSPGPVAEVPDLKNSISTPSFESSHEESVATEGRRQQPVPEPAAKGRAVEPIRKKAEVRVPSDSRRAEKAEKAEKAQGDTSLRVQIGLLDTLMTLAGELVLSRNQMLQAVSSSDRRSMELAAQRIDHVTSELQEAIMFTRMQPIGNIFNKFPRVVRDLSIELNKEIALVIEGKEVEMDKTLIEGLSDPLTHLVRNAIDHGIEHPEDRVREGKNPVGQVTLKAFHEAGQVNIEIKDDGRGMDGARLTASALSKGLISEDQARTMSDKEKIGLIFLPGFSTAEKVTDVSGRGVGMDVVKTNLDRLGGMVDISSHLGQGSTIRIKLPLTLAILPSLLVTAGNERFAIPQVNVDELLRIPAAQVKSRIERVGDAEVVRLRETLLPLLRLTDVLGLERTYVDPEDGQRRTDRRTSVAERRSKTSPLFKGEQDFYENADAGNDDDRRWASDRRFRASSAVNIVVVSAGTFKYGLVVDALHDSEEIVVKPLGRHLKQCRGYAGATIMGDGRVALILDVASLAHMAELTSLGGTDRVAELIQSAAQEKALEMQSLLLFRYAPDDHFAVPLDLVARVERIEPSQIEVVGGKRVMQYRGGSLPLFSIDEVAGVKPMEPGAEVLVIVFSVGSREVGFLAAPPVDAVEIAIDVDGSTLRQPGIMGSAIIGKQTTLIVDIFEIMEKLNPSMFEERKAVQLKHKSEGKLFSILLAEDSDFFRNQVKRFLEEDGHKVHAGEDGLIAWNLLQKHGSEISLVVTDIEMPNMNGYELSKKIKGDPRFKRLPIIAVTSLASDDDVAKGKAAGVDEYQVKLDKEKLLESIHRFLMKD